VVFPPASAPCPGPCFLAVISARSIVRSGRFLLPSHGWLLCPVDGEVPVGDLLVVQRPVGFVGLVGWLPPDRFRRLDLVLPGGGSGGEAG